MESSQKSQNGEDPQSNTPTHSQRANISPDARVRVSLTSNDKSFTLQQEKVSSENIERMITTSRRDAQPEEEKKTSTDDKSWNIRPNVNVNSQAPRRMMGRQMSTQSPSNKSSPLPRSGGRQKSPFNFAKDMNKKQLEQMKL